MDLSGGIQVPIDVAPRVPPEAPRRCAPIPQGAGQFVELSDV